MLTHWGLTNFKSIYDLKEKDFELAPLTVLTGANSSGKSSLIQSMLLVAQTLQSNISDRTLVLNEPLVNLGTFGQIMSHGKEENRDTMKIAISLDPEDTDPEDTKIKKIRYETEFGKPTKVSDSPTIKKIRALIKKSNGTDCAAFTIENKSGKYSVNEISDSFKEKLWSFYREKASRDIILPKFEEGSLKDKLYEDLGNIIKKAEKIIKIIPDSVGFFRKEGFQPSHIDMIIEEVLLPVQEKGFSKEKGWDKDIISEIFENFHKKIEKIIESNRDSGTKEFADRFGYQIENMSAILKQAQIGGTVGIWMDRYSDDMNKLPELNTKLNHFVCNEFTAPFVMPKTDGTEFTIENKRDVSLSPEPLPRAGKLLTDYFINSFKYLGPFRFRDDLSPSFGGNYDKDVGINGKYAAAVYDLYQGEEFEYISCQCFNEKSRKFENFPAAKKKRVFSKALNEWANYLGIAKKIGVKPIDDKYKIQVTQKDSDNKVNLTHVGTGVSQVFPILVMGLLADKKSTLIFEEVEQNLHPGVQSRLADFFLSMALLGKQCIVETHSEYFITQLRYRISNALQRDDKSISVKTKIYFSEKNGRETHFREIKVTKYGGISEWPEGFFDERQKINDKMLDAMGTAFEDDDDDQSDY